MEKMISASLLEILHYDGPGYLPLIDFSAWRVALMNYTPDLVPEKIYQMQKHTETDEVFVLLAGKCILFLGEGNERIEEVYGVDMQPFQLYNVKRGVWHSHTFSRDAKVLIVENCDTTEANSPFLDLTAEQRLRVQQLVQALWGREG
jgi:ureidoglycolate hydrolase